MTATGPNITDLKKLFARSGNRCAFPKCAAAIVDNDTLLGEVAHIKGFKQGSARHDPLQTPEARHAYDNLLLLCPNHHTIIDDDEFSYTAERLYSIKAAHESSATPVSDTVTNKYIKLFITQPVSIVGATGVVAGVIHSQHVVLPSTTDTALQTRRVVAIENLWATLQRFRSEFYDLVLIDTILLPNEIDVYLRTAFSNMFTSIQAYASEQAVADKIVRADKDSTNERPFINPRAWGIVHVLKALYGRTGFLWRLSFKEKKYRNWKDDEPLDHLLRAVLPGHVVDEAKNREIGGLHFLFEHLEISFLHSANTQPNS